MPQLHITPDTKTTEVALYGATRSNDLYDQLTAIYVDAFNRSAGFDAWDHRSARVELDRILASGRCHIKFSEQGDILGFAMTQPLSSFDESVRLMENGARENSLYLTKLATHSNARGLGVGDDLIQIAVSTLEGGDFDELVLRVREGNKPMEALLDRHSFRRVGGYLGATAREESVRWNIYSLACSQLKIDLSAENLS